ncbi:MAG TPA: phospholipid scramblase-related protein [Chitinophagaceae bacterium]|nr:phospholipid scramblase-related protein [Chitinophagaceae bacterium]
MHTSLQQNVFFVKEHVGLFKGASNYDVYHPESRELLIECREPNIGFFTKLFRILGYKVMTPFNIEVRATDGTLITRITRGTVFFRSVVEVFDEKEQLIGKFRQRMLSLGGKFDVLDANDQVICTLKGKWASWEFSFMKDNAELAKVTKKWAGLGKEMFTTADNYALEINPAVGKDSQLRTLILAAVLCIDMVLKENNG